MLNLYKLIIIHSPVEISYSKQTSWTLKVIKLCQANMCMYVSLPASLDNLDRILYIRKELQPSKLKPLLNLSESFYPGALGASPNNSKSGGESKVT